MKRALQRALHQKKIVKNGALDNFLERRQVDQKSFPKKVKNRFEKNRQKLIKNRPKNRRQKLIKNRFEKTSKNRRQNLIKNRFEKKGQKWIPKSAHKILVEISCRKKKTFTFLSIVQNTSVPQK